MSVRLPVSCRHTATRALLGSGALFAWAFVPKIARAEGRDPRFLTIVLRGGTAASPSSAWYGSGRTISASTPTIPCRPALTFRPASPVGRR
jgi:hypothetical protein